MGPLSKSPTLQQLMAELRRLGKDSAAKTYARHGVRELSVGLSYAELGKLAKKLGTVHELSLQLWNTGVHDARVLATKIADPAQLGEKQFEAWLADAANYVISDALSSLAARMPGAAKSALRWIKSKQEWRAATGWNVLAALALEGALDTATANTLIDAIEAGIHRAPNRARYSMNSTLIAIGGSLTPLRGRALQAATAIGTVEVDHGQTGCKTPAAASYIQKMAERAASKSAALP
jgi:3-methyladenine DNA glycosylase AlkD